jgi:hypothetical protein
MSQVLEDLKAAREIIAEPGRWTRHVYARDANGCQLTRGEFEEFGAVCFCVMGALWKAVGDPSHRWIVDDYRNHRNRWLNGICELDKTLDRRIPLADYNDTKTHAEVIEIMDMTIKRLENQ